MERIINELKLAVSKGNGGALIQFNSEETLKVLGALEKYEALERAAYNSCWAESNRIDAERNRGHQQGEG